MKQHWILYALALCGLVAHATPLDDKLKAFNQAVTASAPKDSTDPRFAGRMISVLDASSYPGGEANLEQAIRQLMATNSSAEVQKAGQDVLDEIKAERKAKADALAAQADAVLNRVPGIVGKAEKPADLDQILEDIQNVQPERSYGYDGSGDIQSQINRLNTAYQFVSQWQDFLSQSENDNIQAALNTLRNLQNQRMTGEAIIPRSQILEQINTLEKKQQATPAETGRNRAPDLGPLLDGIKTLDDLSAAASKLGSDSNYGYPQSQGVALLEHYAFMYGQAKNGLPITLEGSPLNYSTSTPPPELARIESMLYTYLLPRFLGPAAPAQNANESPTEFLDRVINSAEAQQDWPLLQRAFTAKIRIGQSRNTYSGTQSFLAGINQEIAGQYALAIESYQSALRSSDDLTPAKIVGDRLAAIKKDHPTEYENGMKRYLTPSLPNLGNYPYGLNPYTMQGRYPGVPPPTGMTPGAPATGATTTPPVSTPPQTNFPPSAPTPR